MKKNGFVMIETIVVITILSVGLISLYVSYSLILTKAKMKSNYDNIEYIYKAYFVGNYLVENGSYGSIWKYINDNNNNSSLQYIMEKLSIEKIYVIPKDLSYESIIPQLDGSSIAYFNKWSDYKADKINIVVKFKKDNKVDFASVTFNEDNSGISNPVAGGFEISLPTIE